MITQKVKSESPTRDRLRLGAMIKTKAPAARLVSRAASGGYPSEN